MHVFVYKLKQLNDHPLTVDSGGLLSLFFGFDFSLSHTCVSAPMFFHRDLFIETELCVFPLNSLWFWK